MNCFILRRGSKLFLDKDIDLSNLNYEIYKYILLNQEKVVYMKIRELAYATHTSVATIQRFCTKFECSGFSEFKIRLKLYIESVRSSGSSVSQIDISSYINFFNRVNESHFQSKIEEAMKVLSNKDLILFLGIGFSNVLAEYGAICFSSIFQMSLRIEDPITNPKNYLSPIILESSCVIVLSVSGETKELINYLHDKNLKNTPIIAITNSESSTIGRLSAVTIPYYIPEEKVSDQNITTQIAPLFIIEYLAKRMHLKNSKILELKNNEK